MKKILGVVIVGVVAVGVAACSSGSKKSGAGVHTGTYNVTNGAFTQDGCNFGSSGSFYAAFSPATAAVTAPGANGPTSFDIDESNAGAGTYTYDITNGTQLKDNTSSGVGVDYCTSANTQNPTFTQCGTINTYNCSFGVSVNYGGTITGANKFTLADTFAFTDGATACPAQVWTSAFGAGVTGPCTSIDSGDFAK